jgi:hypothetical protein
MFTCFIAFNSLKIGEILINAIDQFLKIIPSCEVIIFLMKTKIKHVWK